MDADDSLALYVNKWHQQWPELRIIDAFVSNQKLQLYHAWQSLFFELHECAFVIENTVVREQKSLWWANELHQMCKKAASHPIGKILQNYPADYAKMVEPFLAIAKQTPIRSSNRHDLFLHLLPMSQAIASVECQLFDGHPVTQVDDINAQLLLMRLPHGMLEFDQAVIPMNLLARHQALHTSPISTALLNDWLDELTSSFKLTKCGNWYRTTQTAYCRRRLNQLRKNGKVKIQFGHAFDAWRAMRASY
jgi:hypothetical protein